MQPKHHPKLYRGNPIPPWSSNLSAGNAKLDEQHITLLELGRDLMRLLETNGCPTLSKHQVVHQTARNQLANLLSDVLRGVLDRAALSRLIAGWMRHHISENDLPVKDYMKHTPLACAAR